MDINREALRERLTQLRAEHISEEKGAITPAEEAMKHYLKCKPLVRVLLRYMQLVRESGAIVDVDTAGLAKYREYLQQAEGAEDVIIRARSGFLRAGLETMEKRADYEPADLMRRLYECIKGGIPNVYNKNVEAERFGYNVNHFLEENGGE